MKAYRTFYLYTVGAGVGVKKNRSGQKRTGSATLILRHHRATISHPHTGTGTNKVKKN